MDNQANFPPLGMTSEEFRRVGKELIDTIADYYDNIEQLKPLSEVKPNYLREIIPENAPEEPESFEVIKADVDSKIRPGNFFGYFPASSSYPGILGDMYSSMFNGIGFSVTYTYLIYWINGPAMTELESITLDWLAKLIGLDDSYLFNRTDGKPSTGGGVIQGSASEAITVSLIAARKKATDKFKNANPGYSQLELDTFLSKLIAIGSSQTHSSLEKATMIVGCKYKGITTGSDGSITKSLIETAVKECFDADLVPFFITGTFGTTAICAIDDFNGIADVTEENDLWFHLDAAYAGAGLICEELRELASGMNRSDSFNFNPHKWMLVNFDLSALWFKNSYYVKSALSIHRDYYKNNATDSGLVQDYKDWQLPLGRRFRSLKLWFVLRTYGAKNIRSHIRKHIGFAKYLESNLRQDSRFKVLYPVHFSLVVFYISKESIAANFYPEIQNIDEIQNLDKLHTLVNSLLHKYILEKNEIFVTPTIVNNVSAIRVAIGAPLTTKSNVDNVLNTVKNSTDLIFAKKLSELLE
ncbi:Aromatic-L-amino-acid decarboxylase [Smittium culicis]|uniref:Aromatic-L-amino-acid decarboxylase n=1 Tax=Smittium culicis TaxID=133412 RepID=A0A1R1Y6G9_9FUNG|nr:Aromatic-L-amino-acid decarboxylase [Smittium culicis]